MKTIAVHLAEGFEEIEAVAPIDILRRAGFKVIIVSVGNAHMVEGSHHISVKADCLFPVVDYSKVDMLVLPGGGAGTRNLSNHEGLKEVILRFHELGKPLAAICAAPTVFGQLGILKGRRAVCFPGHEDKLDGATLVDASVVTDGNIITARAAGSAIEFGLAIVAMLEGPEKAVALASTIVTTCGGQCS